MKTISPFEITKAVDFSDEEIMKYWVDLSQNNGFENVIKPSSPMPMIILGAKGSGKTHLMRYYSFQLQKMRNPNDVINGLRNEGFLGIYTSCSGLNPNRFNGKGIAPERWEAIFAYYFELWLAQITLNTLKELATETPSDSLNETLICEEIIRLFDNEIKVDCETFVGIIECINSLRKDVDLAVNNAAIPGRIDELEIKVTTGKLIFGIPKIIVRQVAALQLIKVLYLIDEYENITESQQRHINTLLREKVVPTTFKIGVRLYGMKTYSTNSGGEENKQGSEFEKLILDQFLRENKYQSFFEKICNNRIFNAVNPSGVIDSGVKIAKYFDAISTDEIIENIKKKYEDKEKPYLEKLASKLKNVHCLEIPKIIDLLRFPDNPLLERTNAFLFYRGWKSKSPNYLLVAEEINKSLITYVSTVNVKTDHAKVLGKFKSDIISQMLDECGEDMIYSGFRELLDISYGIPRVLMILLKNITKWSIFKDEKPFCKDSKISIRAQINGLKETSEWFWDDARMPGKEGELVKKCIIKIARLLRNIRYSDLPPECSLTAFSYDEAQINSDSKAIIDLAEKFSFIVKVGTRQAKNSKDMNPIYQINRILAPKWDLPIYKRGELTLEPFEVNVIFADSSEEEYNLIVKNRLQRYNAPFNNTYEEMGLFHVERG